MSESKFYTTWRVVIACQLRRRRVVAKVSQSEFAKRMGMSQSAWSRIEKGRSSLPAHRLVDVFMSSGPIGNGIAIPAIDLSVKLKLFGVDVLTKPDPKRVELDHKAIYGLLYP